MKVGSRVGGATNRLWPTRELGGLLLGMCKAWHDASSIHRAPATAMQQYHALRNALPPLPFNNFLMLARPPFPDSCSG